MSSQHNTDYHRASHLLPEAKRLHERYPRCDGHNDIAWWFRSFTPTDRIGGVNEFDLTQNYRGKAMDGPNKALHTDIPRMRMGGVGWQVKLSTAKIIRVQYHVLLR